MRTACAPLNYAELVLPPPCVYQLGPGDLLELTIPGLFPGSETRPISVDVLDTGELNVPMVGAIAVDGLTMAQAQAKVNATLANGILVNPSASLRLVERGTVSVLVLGEVEQPGVHRLPRYENDVGHAVAAAGGFTEEADDTIEIHRRATAAHTRPLASGHPDYPLQPTRYDASRLVQPASHTDMRGNAWFTPTSLQASEGANSARGTPGMRRLPDISRPPSVTRMGPVSWREPAGVIERHHIPTPQSDMAFEHAPTTIPQQQPIIRIPLRFAGHIVLTPDLVALNTGDVIVIPKRKDEVFYVVGKLSESNRVRFSVGDRDREIGNGFLLPEDREIDVVTAVAMAGYIDPIESPTTVTVHRTKPDGMPLLVTVDLIEARADPRETILVQPGDIIYLNPDGWWYSRYLFDRIVDRALGTAIGRWLTN